MRRCLILTLTLLIALPLAAQGNREQTWELIGAAQKLIETQQYGEAEAKLLQAKALEPEYPDVYSNLGYLYYKWGHRAKAMDAYGQLLSLRPDHAEGRKAMKLLFYSGDFPRTVRAPYLAFSGVGFATDEVRVQTAEGEGRRRIAYTTSMLFHEAMKQPGKPATVPAIPIPVTAEKAVCRVNRSCYGYVMDADSDQYRLALIISWPSSVLEDSRGKEFGPLAARLMHLLLRYHCYERLTMNRSLPDLFPAHAYLCATGPSGAETYRNALYFYDVANTRPAIEWARQAAHELGHLVLPEIGRFTRPEPFASGELGERLFIQYLALEAGLVAGDPWPSRAAQQALSALWPGEEFTVADYISRICRTSLDYWLTAGPDSPLATGQAEDAMQYYVGFLLWTQAAHGPEMLRGVLQTAGGPDPAQYVLAYRALVTQQADKGPLTLDAGCLNLAASKLTERPLEGALGRRNVTLAPGDSATFTVFLPAGGWTLFPQPCQPALTALVDGKGPLPLDDQGSVALGQLQNGWHTLTLQLSDKGQPLVLQRLILRRSREA
jgi:tetratricopeptide (TPR) repeat protein